MASVLQALRQAFEHGRGGSFEALLRAAQVGRGGQGSPPELTLLRAPCVFTLALGWDSAQVRHKHSTGVCTLPDGSLLGCEVSS